MWSGRGARTGAYLHTARKDASSWCRLCLCPALLECCRAWPALAGDLKRLIKKTAEAGKTLDEASIWSFFAQVRVYARPRTSSGSLR